MIEINLLPPEMRKKEAPKLVIPNFFNRKFLLMLAGGFLAAHLLLAVFVVYQHFEFGGVKNRIASLKEGTQEIVKQKSEIKFSREQIAKVQSLTERKFSWAMILNSLTDSVPKGLWLRTLELGEEARTGKAASKAQDAKAKREAEQKVQTLRLEGSVIGGQETATIGRFIKSLKEDPYFGALFDEIQFFNITQRKIKSFDVYDFAIVCVFKKGKF